MSSAAPEVYLDAAATSHPKSPAVVEAMTAAVRDGLGNPGRAGHRFSRAAAAVLQRCRDLAAELFGGQPERWILTGGCTDGLNAAVFGLAHRPGVWITGRLEHHSVRRPLWSLAREGTEIAVVEPDAAGLYQLAAVVAAAAARPVAGVVLQHASNVLGVVHPLAEIGAWCADQGTPFVVDAAQTAGHWPLRVETLHADVACLPAHKGLGGPMGIGLMHVGPKHALRPRRFGGAGAGGASIAPPEDLPYALEAGTANVPGAAGLAAALAETLRETVPRRQELERQVGERLHAAVPKPWRIAPPALAAERLAVACFNIPGLAPPEAAAILEDRFGVMVRTGMFCAPEALGWLGLLPDGCVRASAGPHTPGADLDAFAAALAELHQAFGD